jgi:cell division protein FtsQ
MRKLIFLLLVIVLFKVLPIFWTEHKQALADLLPIKYVRVEGLFQYISKDTIQKALEPYVKTDFFSVDMQVIHQVVMQLPWMKKATVKRVWPDAIDIKVYEQIPAVRWGEKGLLNPAGELFTPESVAQFQDLPLIVGPKGFEARLLEIMKGLETALAERSLHLAEFKVNERRAWEIVLKNGMVIKLGRNGQLKNFQRFLKTLDLLGQEKVDAIAKVDLRYPNGFAITWKLETPMIDWKSVASNHTQQLR